MTLPLPDQFDEHEMISNPIDAHIIRVKILILCPFIELTKQSLTDIGGEHTDRFRKGQDIFNPDYVLERETGLDEN